MLPTHAVVSLTTAKDAELVVRLLDGEDFRPDEPINVMHLRSRPQPLSPSTAAGPIPGLPSASERARRLSSSESPSSGFGAKGVRSLMENEQTRVGKRGIDDVDGSAAKLGELAKRR